MRIAIGLPFDLEKPDGSGFFSAFQTLKDSLSEHELIIFSPGGGDVKLEAPLYNSGLLGRYENTIALSRDFAHKVKEFKPDKIMAFNSMGLFLNEKFIYYTSNMPYKKILKLVEGEYPDTEKFRELIEYYKFLAEKERENYEKADKIIVLSEKIKEAIFQDYNISPEKIAYIPRPIPKIQNLHSSKTNDKMKVILMPAELRVMKGLRYALETMKILKEKVPEAVLIICGRINPYEKDFVISMINEAKGKANFIVAGYLLKEKLYGYMEIADCAFMPFCFDECPILLAECIACCLPVVTNEYAGYSKEAIDEFGYCAKYKDIDDYSQALVKMLSDTDFNMEKRQGAKEIAKKINFDKFREGINSVFK